MSYDVWLEIDYGNGNKTEVGDMNYTSNVSRMWRKALSGSDFDGLAAMDGQRATDCVVALRQAASNMAAFPEAYEAMNPANKWGNANGAREFLTSLAALCELHPTAHVRVSR